VEGAKAQVEEARLNLSYTTITSPVTGLSSSARQTDGTYTNPQNSLLTTVAVLHPIWVNFSVSENEMYKYRGMQAKGLLRAPKYEEHRLKSSWSTARSTPTREDDLCRTLLQRADRDFPHPRHF